MTDPVVIGIDLGSSGARAAAVSPDGVTRCWVHEHFPEASTWPAGRADPKAWLSGLDRVLQAVVSFDAEVAAIGIGGQAPTTVPMGDQFAVTCRSPVGSGLSRRDQHVAQHVFLEKELGCAVVPAQSWDWALRKLGADNIQGLWPAEELLPGFGEPVGVGTIIGESDGSLGVRKGIPLVSGSSDAYMSFWAGGLGEPGRGLDPGGRTGGLGVAVLAADRPEELYGFPGAVADVEVVGGPVNGHGELLEWWAAVSGKTIPELLAVAELVPAGSDGVLVLPYQDGERAPRWETRLSGEIYGLNFNTGVPEIARAVLECAAYGLRHIYEELKAVGVEMDVLTCGGSPAKSRLWNSIKASVLEVPVDVSDQPEQMSAYGCALAAGAGVGWWEGVGADDMGSWPLPPRSRVEPEPSKKYREGYERFVALGDASVARLNSNSSQ